MPVNADDDRQNEAFLDAIADADPYPYWYDDKDEPDSNPTLVRTESCDLCVVGGGYTGLWTAIIAKERDPRKDVVLIEAHEVVEDEETEVPDLEADPDDGPACLRVRLSGAAARAFAKRALTVVSAGRPPCPFCNLPLEPSGHICPRANGYRR